MKNFTFLGKTYSGAFALSLMLSISGHSFSQEALFVDGAGDIGIGTSTPEAALHVVRSDAGATELIRMENDGGSFLTWEKTSTNANWFFTHENAARGAFIIDHVFNNSPDGPEFLVDTAGNLEIQGTLSQGSDINSKQDIRSLDSKSLLIKLEKVPVSEWSYKSSPDIRHIGPMAQDFHAAFGLGPDDKHIAARNMAGVNMAAIQALSDEIKSLRAENKRKDTEISSLRADLEMLRTATATTNTMVQALLKSKGLSNVTWSEQ